MDLPLTLLQGLYDEPVTEESLAGSTVSCDLEITIYPMLMLARSHKG